MRESRYSISEALHELRTASKIDEATAVAERPAKRKTVSDPFSNKLTDLFDQVYVSLTDAGINAVNADVPFKNKYGVRFVSRDAYKSNDEFDVIAVSKHPYMPNIDNDRCEVKDFNLAKEVAEYYGLKSEETEDNFFIYVPADAPVMADKVSSASKSRYEDVEAEADELSEALILENKFTDSIKKVATRLGADAATILRCFTELGEMIKNIGNDGEYKTTKLNDFMEYVENKAALKALMSGNERVMNTLTKDDIDELVQDVEDYKNAKAAEKAAKDDKKDAVTEGVELEEDVASSMPVTILDQNAVRSFIEEVPVATADRPPVFFPIGYIREFKSEIPAKYRGGRGSEGQPTVRIFKCFETTVYTGADYENLGSTKLMRKETGKERSGERTGFTFDGGIGNKIGISATGAEQLQCYPKTGAKNKVKYFISLDDEDLREVSAQEVAQYLTPAQAAALTSPRVADEEGSTDYKKPLRLKLTGIYKIGNLGRSVM